MIAEGIQARRASGVMPLMVMASIAASFLVALRTGVSMRAAYWNLVWNLVLAWSPIILLRFGAARCRSTRSLLVLLIGWWLLFPNTPYLVTDWVHLRARPPVPLWFDIVLLQAFVCLGLGLTVLALEQVRGLLTERFNARVAWSVVVVAILSAGFGIYLGRFERLNSWDAVIRPHRLVESVIEALTDRRRPAAVFSFLFSALIGGVYTVSLAWRNASLKRQAL